MTAEVPTGFPSSNSEGEAGFLGIKTRQGKKYVYPTHCREQEVVQIRAGGLHKQEDIHTDSIGE